MQLGSFKYDVEATLRCCSPGTVRQQQSLLRTDPPAAPCTQIATRMYGYPSRPNKDVDYMQLLPVFDMANCADKGVHW